MGDGPRFGEFLAGLGDVDGDGNADILVGGQTEIDGVSGAGAVWCVPGPVTAPATFEVTTALLVGETSRKRVGRHATGAGDLDGDGLMDVLVGSYLQPEVAIVYGPATGSDAFADADALISGAAGSLYGGDRGVAAVGDVTSDGKADILVGNLSDAFIYAGPVRGTLTSADADAAFLGPGDEAGFGFSVAGVGDVDGDGVPDIAASWNTGLGPAYAVAIHFGPFAGSRSGVEDSDATFGEASTSTSTYAYRAASWSPTLDVMDMDANGDGRADVLLGGHRTGTGTTHFLFTSGISDATVDAADTIITGVSGGSAGAEATWSGDLNQDGHADVAVGDAVADSATLDDIGIVRLFYGPLPSGTLDTSDADATLKGGMEAAFSGGRLSAGGELTGDGYPDLLVSAYGETLGGTAQGVAWIIPGGP